MMDVTMCSRSPIRSMHSLTGTPSFRRTSTIVRFTSSGSRPTLIVRLAWLSRSIRRTRFPFAARATPRLCVVVVFATPPFWFAIAIIFKSFTPYFIYIDYSIYLICINYIPYLSNSQIKTVSLVQGDTVF